MNFRLPLFFILVFLFSSPLVFASDVEVQKDSKGQWRLLVDGKPYFVRGVDYRVSKIGESPDEGNLGDWATYDFNRNGKCDPAYDSWIDKNRNNRRDFDEPVTGDFELLRAMGVNTIRWYHNDFKNQFPKKAMLLDLYKTYGIRVAVGDKFGAYTIGSGASWKEGTNYLDPRQRENMRMNVQRMVNEHKTEPYVLLWVLGNENNLPYTNTNAAKYPVEYVRFLNETAKMIHEMDPMHPVAVVNGDVNMIYYYKKYGPDIDIFGSNCYRGPNGFGSFWKEVRMSLDKPALITEYGGAQAHGYNETEQAAYHQACWKDIFSHRAGMGEGNAIGGFAFEWIDEWWKAGDAHHHSAEGTTGKQGVGQTSWTQEYCGIMRMGNGNYSPFLRQPRKVYFMYQKLWNQKEESQ